MAYVKIIFQNSPSTATPLNAQNLNHMDDQIALNDQRLTEIETSYVKSFKSRTGDVVPEKGDYDINQINATDGQNGYVPVWRNSGTEEDPDWGFEMEAQGGAGHVLVDSDGNNMPSEDKMQFADAFLTDDSVNGRTVVENVKSVASADYSSETEDGMYLIPDGEGAVIGPASDDYVEVTADGDKTYATLLNEIATAMDFTKVRDNALFVMIYNGTKNISVLRANYGTAVTFFQGLSENAGARVRNYYIEENGSIFEEATGSSYTDKSTTKPTNGTVIRLYYGNKKATVDLQTTANRCWYDSSKTVKQKIDDIKISIKTVTFTTNSVGAFEVSNDVTEFCLGLMFSVGDEYTYYQYNNRAFILFNMAGQKILNTTVTARAIITHI